MVDFSWLNGVPDCDWPKQGDGGFKAFPLGAFLKNSGLQVDDEWEMEFEQWGLTQPRKYQSFPGPADYKGEPLAWIACDSWSTGHGLA